MQITKPETKPRITVTERGRQLQRELMKELKTDSQMYLSPRIGQSHSPRLSEPPYNSVLSNRGPLANDRSHFSPPHESSYMSRGYDGSFRSRTKEDEYVRLPRIDFKPELEQNPFLKKKMAKINNDITKLEMKPDKASRTESTPLLVNMETSYIPSMGGYDQSINTANTRRTELDDKHTIRSYVKMLHRESEIETLLKRHQKNLNTIARTQQRVEKKYNNLKKSEEDEKSKPPAFLEQIQQHNPSAIEALHRTTNYDTRRFGRVNGRVKKVYESYWNHFQDLSRKK